MKTHIVQIHILLLLLITQTIQAQNESPGDIFFSSAKNKVAPRAFFTADINGSPEVVNDTILVSINLNAAQTDDIEKYLWLISGPKGHEVSLQSTTQSTTTILSVPAKKSGKRNYSISLTVVSKTGASLSMMRKLKFEVTRSDYKNFGDDLSYTISSIWIN